MRADKKALETKKRIKDMCCGNPEEDKTYLIVGGGKNKYCQNKIIQFGLRGSNGSDVWSRLW